VDQSGLRPKQHLSSRRLVNVDEFQRSLLQIAPLIPPSVMLTFALFGAGRIGAVHAANLATSGATVLRYVIDVNSAAAEALAQKYCAKVASAAEALADPAIQAVIIGSSTDTHADLIIDAARAGKAIFCEKPIDLSLKRVDECLAVVKQTRVPLLVGFNRRFDPSFSALRARIDQGSSSPFVSQGVGRAVPRYDHP
jgi:myo-inositol 2-dehydrogenase/D-chiro-inositol 1-dehydrogenase